MPADLISLLADRAARTPDRLAFRFLADGERETGTLSYGELDRRARALAARLRALGEPGDRAILFHPPGLEYVVALLGCWHAGMVPVPAYPPRGHHLERLRALVTDARARFALTTAAVRERLGPRIAADPALAALAWPSTDEAEGPPSGAAPAGAPRRALGDLALLQYTSGSTADPKGVMIPHRALLAHTAELAAAFGVGPEDHLVSWLPPYHDMGLIGAILTPLSVGASVTLLPPGAFLQRPLRWLQAVAAFGGTLTGAPDFAWDLCARRATPELARALDLTRLRVAFSGAERVRPETLERFAAAFAPSGFRREAFVPTYGLAEATLGLTSRPLGALPAEARLDEAALRQGRAAPAREGAAARRLASCGRPVGSAELQVADPETLRPVEEGVVGEIWARGAGVADGYWNRPELTARTFGARLAGEPDGARPWLRTGDLGFLRAGELYVAGRRKDVLILLGFNHHPEDLEATAEAAHPRLRPRGGAAFSVEVDGEERLVVVHEVDDPRLLPAGEVLAALREAVAEAHQVPVHEAVLVPPGGVPRTSSGKVQRSLCRERYLSGELAALARGGRPAAAEAPAALVEEVARHMASVLGVGQVAAEEDFFALGGHSLLATLLASRLADARGVEVPLRLVFEAPTPAALAGRLLACAPAAAPAAIPTVDRSGPLQLSFSQERMWYLHQLDPGGSAYNVAGGVFLRGEVDPDRLARALHAVVARHEVLGTRYASVDGVPHSLPGPAPALELTREDLSSRGDPRAAAVTAAEALAASPFDLTQGRLVRAGLLRLGPAEWAMVLSAHHVVVDGWSMGVLLAEILEADRALAEGRAVAPARAGPAYADYAAWQRTQLGAEAQAVEVEHWRRRLAGAPRLELPADGRRGPSRRGAREFVTLPPATWDRLRELARAEGATLYMVMLAAFEVLLHRHTGETDLVVGTPIANRHRSAAEGLVGTLVNTVPVRVQVDPEAPFRALLGAVRESALDALSHQELPFERLVAALGLPRRGGETPLFPVLFDFLNAPMPSRRTGPLEIEPLAFSRRAAQFDLALSVLDTALGQQIGFEYRVDLFSAGRVRRLADHFGTVLEAVAADPALPVSRIPLLSAAEREEAQARADAACPGRPADVPLPALFEAQARRTPEAVAVVDGAGALTYRELLAASEGLAARLRALGAGPGERVAVCLERSRAVPMALLAVLRTGAAYVPLDPRHPAERLAGVMEDAAPTVLVTTRALRARSFPEASAAVIDLDEGAGAAAPPAAPPELGPGPGPGDVAYLIYTSGSTGRPKGVEVTHLGLSNFLASMAAQPGLSAHDRLLSVTTISFDIAGLELFLPLSTGAQVHVASAEEVADGARLAALLTARQATVMQATPATWRLLLEAGWSGDPGLKILCGGEAMDRDLADQLLSRAGEVWNVYGPTETTIWSALWRVQPGEGAVPVGLPVAHNRLYVLDRHGEHVPLGVTGEIHIGGAGVAKGYWRRPELTAERFVADPFAGPGARMYRTGDLGRFRADGALECLGRLDHQVKIRGHRVEPGEVEAVLREHPGVAAAAVVARQVAPGDVRLAAYWVARETPGPGRAELREALRKKLPEHMVPAFMIQLAALPLNPSGKLDRRALPEPGEAHAVLEVERVAPRTPLEAEVADHFAAALGVPVTSVRDGFFDLGGHSLLAARLFARLEKATGVALPLAVLLEHQTVEALAALIRDRQAAPAPAAPAHVVPIRASGARPAFFCVHGAGGNVLNLRDLARHLPPDRPFHALQARGLDGREAPFGSIEEAAAAYLAEVRTLQPRGPYFLGGYCGGGLVAYEMAQALLAAGEAVAVVVLIDTPGPSRPAPGPGRLSRWTRLLLEEDLPALGRRLKAKVERDSRIARREAALRSHSRRDAPIPVELRDAWLADGFIRAAARYRVRPLAGPLLVFRARDGSPGQPEHLGWDEVAAGGLTVEVVPGNHHSLAQEPHVQVLSARLEAALRAAEVPGAGGVSGLGEAG